jgi:hypothetical protein
MSASRMVARLSPLNINQLSRRLAVLGGRSKSLPRAGSAVLRSFLSGGDRQPLARLVWSLAMQVQPALPKFFELQR